MKATLLVIGVFMLLYGLHWIGQGTGWLPWPAHTLMDYNRAFIWYGLGMCVVSAVLIITSLRRTAR